MGQQSSRINRMKQFFETVQAGAFLFPNVCPEGKFNGFGKMSQVILTGRQFLSQGPLVFMFTCLKTSLSANNG